MIRNLFGSSSARTVLAIGIACTVLAGCGSNRRTLQEAPESAQDSAETVVQPQQRARFGKPAIREGELYYASQSPAVTSIPEFLEMYTDEELAQVTKLNLSRNEIDFVDGLGRVPNLYELILNQNSIQTIENAAVVPDLGVLSLIGNQITSIEAIPTLPTLRALSLSRNQIESTRGLGRFPSLTYIALERNPLSNFDALLQLEGLTYVSFGVAEGVTTEEAASVANRIRENNPGAEVYW